MKDTKKEKTSAKGTLRIPARKAARILEQVDRMFASPAFKVTPAQEGFFRFVVEKAIAGKTGEINGYTVATHVFKRNSDFDPGIDPIVSVQAARLRKALEDYYLGAGRNDRLHIDIPRGGYVPRFHQRTLSGSENRSEAAGKTGSLSSDRWPSVMVAPIENLTGDPRLDYLTLGFATELAAELSRYQDIRVLMQPPGESVKIISKRVTRYAIEGDIKRDPDGIKVSFRLVDRSTGYHLWATSHHSYFGAAEVMAFQEETARVIAGTVAGEHGVIALTLSNEAKRKPPSELEAYEAILRYYEFDLSLSPETYLVALAALENALKIEEDCDQVCSMLGRLYAVNYSLEFFPQPEGLTKAMRFAQKGVMLNRENQRARAILAYCLILGDEISEAKAELDRALALNPESLFFSDTIGYLMVLCGAFDEGIELVRRTMSQNPYYSLQAHDALCYYWLRREEYERAYEQTRNFRRPSNFWEPLIKAALLGLLGRIDDGKVAANELLHLKPDFRERGIVLIKHYVKFDEILDPFLSGLRKVGLELS